MLSWSCHQVKFSKELAEVYAPAIHSQEAQETAYEGFQEARCFTSIISNLAILPQFQ